MQDWNDLEEFARGGSGEAFARLVQRYARPVYAMCLRQLGDRPLAEDATQAVFLILSQRAGRLRRGTVLSGWLFQTARYVCANAWRAIRRRQDHEREASMMRARYDEPSKQQGQHELTGLLDDAIASLRPRDRDTLLLRFAQDLSTAEVAARLDLTEEAVRKRLSRAINRLRQYFAKSGVAVDAGAIVTVLSPAAWPEVPQALAQNLVAVGAANAAGVISTTAATSATTLAKGALFAMNAHLVKTSVSGVAAVIALFATGGAVVRVFSSPPSNPTSQAPAIQVLAAGSNATAQLPASIDEAERLAEAGDWSGAIDVYGQYLRTLATEQYRDKKDFDWILQKFEAKAKPVGPDGYRPLRLIAEQKRADRPADDPDVWRLHRLLAEISSKVGDTASQRDHLERAIAAYPAEVEGDPSKHSSLQHLYNSVAMLIAQQDLDEAEKYILDHFENDGRFIYMFLPPWRQLFASKGQAARYEKFVDRVLATYELRIEKDPDLRELFREYAAQARQLREPQRR